MNHIGGRKFMEQNTNAPIKQIHAAYIVIMLPEKHKNRSMDAQINELQSKPNAASAGQSSI